MADCKQCTSSFEITDEDRRLLNKFEVPDPLLCPPCRSQRRLSWRNERNLYKRKCDLTEKDIVSIYSPDKPFTVYSLEAWFSDDWEALDYGMDFDFSRPFFEQFKELQGKVPRIGLIVTNNENCPYINQSWNCKNSHMCFDMGFSEDVMYSEMIYHSKNILDSTMTRNSELSYSLVDCVKCYNSFWLQDCGSCSDAYFSYDCNQCNNVAFCYNLRSKKNYLFNRQVSEEEFKRVQEDIRSGSFEKWKLYVDKFRREVLPRAIRKENHNLQAENCTGDYILKSRDCHQCFDVETSDNCRYSTRLDERIISCMDLDNASIAELVYDSITITGYNVRFSHMSYHQNNSNLTYCDSLRLCSDCLGCISLKNKKHCILNKQYTKEEYEELIPKIIEHMKETGEWGEFFPSKLSPFAYNETVAHEYYPLTKEDVSARGLRWKENNRKDYQQQTYTLSDNISDTPDTVINELLACAECGRNYKIISQELKSYRNMGLPVPRKCHECRHDERVVLRNPRKLFDRKCDNCQAAIQSTYPPPGRAGSSGRPEKVFCEDCYLKTVY